MSLARHGSGSGASLRALTAQIHPVFMLPPVAAAAVGAVLAREATLTWALVHMLAIGAAVYIAHVRDGYIDFFHRAEDDDFALTTTGVRFGVGLGLVTWTGCAATLALGVDVGTLALTVPPVVIGYAHAPYLDMTTIGETFGYPVGIGFAVLGGYYVQVLRLDPIAGILAAILVSLVAGVKIIDDEQDLRADRRRGKPSVSVVFGRRRGRYIAMGLIGAALASTAVGALIGPFPVSAIAAPAVLLPVIAVGVRAPAELGTALLIRGCYVFLAVLVAAVWLQPG